MVGKLQAPSCRSNEGLLASIPPFEQYWIYLFESHSVENTRGRAQDLPQIFRSRMVRLVERHPRLVYLPAAMVGSSMPCISCRGRRTKTRCPCYFFLYCGVSLTG